MAAPQAAILTQQEAFMSNAAIAMGGKAAVTSAELGWKFIH